MIDPNDYFDVYSIVVNEFVGDIWLVVIIGMILIAYWSIKSKMSYELTITFELLWASVMFAADTGLVILWAFAVLFVGVIFYQAMTQRFVRV